MKILMIGPRNAYPHPEGGLDRYVKDLAEFLAQEGNSVTLFCHKGDASQPPRSPSGIALKTIGTIKRHHLDTLVYGLRATLQAVREPAEIVHYHGGVALFSWIPRIFGKRVVVTIHSQEWRSPAIPWATRAFYHLAEWVGCRSAHRLSAVSQTLTDKLRKGYRRPVICLPIGIRPPSRPGASQLAPLGLKPQGYLLSLGRIERGKGIELLIQAYQAVSRETSYSLVIAGKPLFDARYLEELKARAGPGVRFVGRVIGSLKEELLANALLYLQASEAEGLSISLLEAMSYGSAVLVSDIPENREAAGDAGLFFPKGEWKGLSRRLSQLLVEPSLLKELGVKARERVEREFSWSRRGPALSQLYEVPLPDS